MATANGLVFFIPGSNNIRAAGLLSTANIYEHDTIFFMFDVAASEFLQGTPKSTPKYMHDWFLRRMTEVDEWIKKGHTLVVLGPKPTPFQYIDQLVGNDFALERYPVLNTISMTRKTGDSVEVVGQQAVIDLLSASVEGYGVVIKGPELVPLITVKTTKNTRGPKDIVAGYVKYGDGLIIFAPDWHLPGGRYWTALSQLSSLLQAEAPELPAWVDHFLTGTEVEMFNGVDSRKKQATKLQSEVDALEGTINSHRQLKALFTATGSQFEKAVADGLTELGFQVVPGPHPRADLIISSGTRIGAVEAKGIEGAAREEFVRQVMMWMPEVDTALSTPLAELAPDATIQDYKDKLLSLDLSGRDTSLDCKGILVLGTFRSLPLSQRTNADFADNVRQVLSRQDVCAMTGLQLYSMVIDARADPALKPKFRQAIMDTRGVIDDLARDWRAILTES
jgi:hypothetical protein